MAKAADDDARPSAFVLMPFDAEFREVYDLFMTETLQAAGYRVTRADDLLAHRSILQDIVESIRTADLVVADLTTGNPNVFYELGLAHAFRRSVILLTQDLEDVPFDLRGYRVVVYDTHFARLPKARAELLALATACRDGRLPLGTPVSDYVPAAEQQSGRGSPLQSATLPPTPDAPDSEGGFLDFLVDVEEGFGQLREVLEGIGGATTEIGDLTNQFTARMNNIASTRASGSASVLRQLTRELALKVSAYARTIAEANERYRSIWTRVGPSLEQLIATSSPRDAEQRAGLQAFLVTIDKVVGQARGARESYARLADIMSGVPRMERQLNQAMNAATVQARTVVDNLDQTIASLERAHRVGQTRLDEGEGGQLTSA